MKKFGKGLLSFFAISFILIGSIGLTGKDLTETDLTGIAFILLGICILPQLKKLFPSIKVWHRILVFIILFFAATGVISLFSGQNIDLLTRIQNQIQTTTQTQTSTQTQTTTQVSSLDAIPETPLIKDIIKYSEFGTYNGEFDKEQRNGYGEFTWHNGDVYEGEWKNGNIHGKGKMTLYNGAVITAEFSENKVKSGQYSWESDNCKYTLFFKDYETDIESDDFQIKIEYEDGTVYEGGFSENTLNGNGKLSYPKTGVYNGNFLNGKKHGSGSFFWEDKDKVSGEWENDELNGKCTYVFSNGGTLNGEFKNNLPSGEFVYTFDGKEYSTVWKNGKWNKPKRMN